MNRFAREETVISLYIVFRLQPFGALIRQVGDKGCLYIGDDDRDEEAFPLVHAHGGAAVKVAHPSQAFVPTEADFIFESSQ